MNYWGINMELLLALLVFGGMFALLVIVARNCNELKSDTSPTKDEYKTVGKGVLIVIVIILFFAIGGAL